MKMGKVATIKVNPDWLYEVAARAVYNQLIREGKIDQGEPLQVRISLENPLMDIKPIIESLRLNLQKCGRMYIKNNK